MFAAFFACSIQSANAQNADAGDIDSGLIGHWTLDDASGSQITDSSSNANHGTWIDNENTDLTEESITAKIRLGLTLDADDRINIPAIPSYNVGTTGSFSASIWFKTNDPSLTFMDIGGGNQIIQMGMDTGRIRFSARDSLGNSTNLPYNLPYGPRNDDKWHLAVLVLDRENNSAHVYIDDVQEQIDSDISNMIGNIGPVTQFRFNGNSSGAEFDDVRYYNRALSADDVALLYKSFPGQVACDATNEAVMIFNHNKKIMQYCNGTDWVNVGHNKKCSTTNCGGDPTKRVVFITPGHNGNHGGITGADAYCQATATAAGLTGTYYAWLTDSNAANAPANRFEQSTVPYVKVNGGVVANNWSDLVDGTLNTAINRSADNTSITNYAFTNTNANGTQNSATEHCSNFTAGVAGTYGGHSGNTTNWTTPTSLACNLNWHLYCFEQGPIVSTGCNSPNGKAGEMNYNLEDGVMQYCDGANWISMGPKSAKAGLSAADLSPSAPTNGLIGHWPLNSNANDALGNSNGSLQNGATIIATNKKLGVGAVELDGTNDHVRIPTTSNINLAGTDEMSVSLWVDLDSVSSGANSLIMWESVNGGNEAEPYRLNVWDAGGGQYFPSFELANASSTTVRLDAGNLNYNGWHHVVGTYDGAEMRIYVDGQLANSAAQTGLIKTPVDGALNVRLLIGAGELSTARFTNGTIDDVRLYNRKLEPDEVQNLYRASSLAAHWKMDETGSTTTAVDSSGNGFDAAMLNGLSGANTTAGRTGSALQIDGTNDRMTVPFNAALHPSQITFCAWVKVNTPTGGYPAIAVTQVWPSRGYNFSIDDTAGDVIWSVLDGAANNLSYNTTVTNWHHYCGTADGYTQNLYVDGNLVGTQSAGYVPMTSGILYLASTTNNINTLNGDIDDVRIYNRILSAEEIATLYTTTGGGGIPITGCPNIGDTCDDGTIYAGISLDGDIPMYTTAADQGSLIWAPAGAYVETFASAYRAGAANTDTIVNIDANSSTPGFQNHPAARACAILESNGYDDWYLPAYSELEELYNNRGVITGSTTARYWSSTESGQHVARAINFSDGTAVPTLTKNSPSTVRCVRKGMPAIGGRCSSPLGVAGEIVYNDDYNLMQYCNGSEWVALGSDYSGSAVVMTSPPSPSDCTNRGDTCPDGSIYVGYSPDGYIRMFATSITHEGSGLSWNDGGALAGANGVTDQNDGDGNTAALLATVDGNEPYLAAQYCDSLTAHGKDDWYLPAPNEATLFYNGAWLADLTGQYWTSASYGVQDATRFTGFSGLGGLSKPSPIPAVRCVRKDASSTAGDPCDGTPAIGATCNNGTIYAGTSPDGSVAMYTTPSDAPGGANYSWNAGNASAASMPFVTADACYMGPETGCQTGELNTLDAAAADSDTSNGTFDDHEAAKYCNDLSFGGETDWYLPAQQELGVLYTNRAAGDLSGTFSTTYPASTYWSSSEVNNQAVITYSFDGSGANNATKENTWSVRCVRKAGASPPADTTPIAFSFTPATGVATSTLSTSNTVIISGITASASVSVSGDGSPQIRINGGSWVTSGTINNAQTLQVRLTSSASASTLSTATVNVGGVTADYDVTTAGASCNTTAWTQNTPNSYTYTVPANCTQLTVQTYGAGGSGSNDKGGGGGGGSSAVIRNTGSTLIAVGGGGGGAGGKNLNDTNGGGGGYAQSVITGLTPGETFTVYVGGGGFRNNNDNGGAGGAVGGGAASGGNGNPATNNYGGGGGGERDSRGGNSVNGGAGGAGRDGSPAGTASGYGGNGGNGGDQPGFGGSGYSSSGGTVISGGNGGAAGVNAPGTAANSGPGVGAYGDTAQAGNGRVVITPAP